MDPGKLRKPHPGWDRCELALWHSFRKTEPYWPDAQIRFYNGSERKKIIFLEPGSKEDSDAVIQHLMSFGYQQDGKRLNQEWEQIPFVLKKGEQDESA